MLTGISRNLTKQGSIFRALTRSYIHWVSGRMDQVEINTRHPQFCHVNCCMKPSMKPGVYHVYIILRRDGEVGNVCTATCECVAEYVLYSHTEVLLKIIFMLHFADDRPLAHTFPVALSPAILHQHHAQHWTLAWSHSCQLSQNVRDSPRFTTFVPCPARKPPFTCTSIVLKILCSGSTLHWFIILQLAADHYWAEDRNNGQASAGLTKQFSLGTGKELKLDTVL